LSSGNIVNYSKEPTRRVDFTISIDYGESIDKVREVLKEIITNDQRVLTTPEPVIALNALADSSVNIALRVWVKSENYWAVYWETNEKIYNEFNRRGINFPFPQLTVHKA
jgi:small conductance mechanosensitive channel